MCHQTSCWFKIEAALLDDVLAALDPEVGHKVARELLEGPLLRDKCKVIALSAYHPLLEGADEILVLAEDSYLDLCQYLLVSTRAYLHLLVSSLIYLYLLMSVRRTYLYLRAGVFVGRGRRKCAWMYLAPAW